MKKIKLIAILVILCGKFYAQGMNNEFDYDKEDLNVIFKELGINTFKFPVRQDIGQPLNFIIEEYENKKLINTISLIEDVKCSFGPLGYDVLSFFKPKKDSVYVHRFYFFTKNDSTIKLQVNSHSINTSKLFSFSGKSACSFNTDYPVEEELKRAGHLTLNERKILFYLYAHSSAEKDKPLWCTTGVPKEKLIEDYYYLIFISMEPYREDGGTTAK